MAATSRRSTLSPLALILLCLASSTLAAPHPGALPHSILDVLLPRAGNTTTSSNPTSTSSTYSASSADSTVIPSSASTLSHGALAGVIIGLVGTAAAFAAIVVIFLRHRAVVRRNKRNHIYTVPAVRREMMDNYAREQQRNLRGSRSRSEGGSGGVRKPSRAARGPKRPSVPDSPPPSYWEDMRPPPA